MPYKYQGLGNGGGPFTAAQKIGVSIALFLAVCGALAVGYYTQ